MKNEILAIQSTSFTSVKTAEELYNIPPAKSNGFECSPHIVRITDTKTLSKDVLRPQVFVSGEIHGDERVGPLASMATTQLLVNSAQCIIEKRDVACEFLKKFPQLTRYQQKWLAFLATRRDTIVVPTANCLGYNFNRRDDAGVDPNRDFSYTRRDNRCFMSTTAKIIYAIMKDNLIQVVVTFHGGMVAIGYEWGSPNHHVPNDASPDHSAYSNIGKLMSTYGGKFKREKPYPVGEINSVIYPVDGGMEDWLYAEGWDSKFLTEDCQGYKELFSYLKIKARHSLLSTQHPYQVPDHPRLRNRPRKMIQNHHSSGRRQLTEATHGNRAIVFLVETSDAKKPSTDSLGGTDNILHPNSPQNGHIPRNVRLTLSAIDLLQPYTCFQSFHLNSHDNENYFNTQWYVGGGFEVSETFLALHSFPRAPVLQTTQDFTQYLRFIANDVALEKALKKNGNISQLGENKMKIVSSVMKGSTRWTFENLNNLSSSSVSSDAELLKPAKLFHGKISLQQHFFPLIKSLLSANTSMKERKFSFWLISWSKVDSDFGRVGQGYPPHLPPQSHYSNIRTNSEWNCSYVGKEKARTCQGRKYWPSDFIEIEVDLIEAKVRVKKEVLDCAWWEYHSSKHSGQSFSFVLPDEWKPQDPKLNSSLNNSNNINQKDSYRETLSTNLIETISQSSSSSIGKNDSSSFIPYHIFHRSEESSFFTVEKIYLLISLLLTIIIAAGVLIANHLRRNRIYNALVSNRYLSLPTGFQR